MWEVTLIESKGSGRRWKQWWSIPAAAGVHTLLFSAALLASYWHVEAVEAPAPSLHYVEAIQVALTPPPALGGGKRAIKRVSSQAIAPRVHQPSEIAPLTKDPEIDVHSFGPPETANSSAGDDAPAGPGNPGGVPGGSGSIPSGNGVAVEDTEPLHITTGVTQPVLIRKVEPEYPRAAAHARIQGIVILEAVITKNGDVEDVRTLRSESAALEKAAKDAVLQWKYKPALVQGRPVKVYFTVTCRFHLR
jgi:periplasmic protein TonB